MPHLTDHVLECYQLGMLSEDEQALVEDHYLVCPECAQRAVETAGFVDSLRAAMILGNFDR
jgi:Putative zinc-finger